MDLCKDIWERGMHGVVCVAQILRESEQIISKDCKTELRARNHSSFFAPTEMILLDTITFTQTSEKAEGTPKKSCFLPLPRNFSSTYGPDLS